MTQARVAQPANLALRDVMVGWLAFHRDALRAKCAGVNWNLVKLIQAYARHNGHADLLRDRVDGPTGE
jgi:Protein of unknown function (DUF664)